MDVKQLTQDLMESYGFIVVNCLYYHLMKCAWLKSKSKIWECSRCFLWRYRKDSFPESKIEVHNFFNFLPSTELTKAYSKLHLTEAKARGEWKVEVFLQQRGPDLPPGGSILACWTSGNPTLIRPSGFIHLNQGSWWCLPVRAAEGSQTHKKLPLGGKFGT